MELPGYTLFRNDRQNRVGGGVAIYVKKPLIFVPLASSVSDNPAGSIEYLMGKISLPSQQEIFVTSVYRPPNTPFYKNTNFFTQLANFAPLFSTKLIMRDFNVDMLTTNPYSSLLNNILADLSLKLVPHGVTNISTDRGIHIDLILVDNDDTVTKFSKSPSPFINTHFLISISLPVHSCSPPMHKFTIRNIKSITHESLSAFFAAQNWTPFPELPTTNEKLTFLDSILQKALNDLAPPITINPHRHPEPWMTQELFILSKQVDQSYRRYKRVRTVRSRHCYRQLKQSFSDAVKAARVSFYKTRLGSLNCPKDIWRELRHLGLTDSTPPPKRPICTATELNHFFVSATHPTTTPPPAPLLSQIASEFSSFSFRDISLRELHKSFSHFSSQATGPDGYSLHFLKRCLPFLENQILHLFNSSLQSSTFPTDWKSAFVLPLNKIPNPSGPADYRPIALLNMLPKIFEKAVSYQIVQHLISNSIIDPFQSGFRSGHSTESCLVKLADDIRQAKAKKYLTALILFDFTKAFDRVNFDILLGKLKRYGFDDHSLAWFESYIKGRLQAVRFEKDGQSDWEEIAQGSVLGPLLFQIYINDIGTSISTCRRLLFADDLQMYLSFPPHQLDHFLRLVCNDVTAVSDWCIRNSLSLNTSKLQAIIIGSKPIIDALPPPCRPFILP